MSIAVIVPYFLVMSLLLLSRPADTLAGTFIVNTTLDTVDTSPGDGICADSSGQCSLRAAILEANADPNISHTVIVGPGLYELTIPGVGENDGLTGDLDIRAPMVLIGDGPQTTFIDAGGLDRVLNVYAPPGDVRISGLTLQNGDVGGDRASSGGGIQLGLSSPAYLTDVHVIDNVAAYGGGISAECCSATLLQDVVVANNYADSVGGGIYATQRLVGTNVVVRENVAGASGGGLWSVGAVDGQAIFSDSLFTGNAALDGNGGGISGTGGLKLDLTRTTVSENVAALDGGGIGDDDGVGYVRCIDSAVVGNEAGRNGGGVFLRFGDAELTNCTISANQAGANAGGVRVGGEHSQSRLSDSTITNNSADTDQDGIGDGGGVVCAPCRNGLVIERTLIARNFDMGGEAPDCASDLTSNGYNLIGDASGCSLSGDLATTLVGVDPLLGPLADNGGPTQTHALLAGSPAIDAGGGGCNAADQRGVARPQFAACDIGAFEFACGNASVDLGEDCDDGNTIDGDCCSSACQFEPSGSSCADSDLCDGFEVCDGAGTCMEQALECKEAGRARAVIVDRADDRKDKIQWAWLRGEAVLTGDLGDPLQETDYVLCIDDMAAGVRAPATRITVPPNGAWTPAGSTGFRYKDRSGAFDGVIAVKLRAGVNGRSRAQVKARGVVLPMPAPVTPFQFFDQDPEVRLNLVNSEGVCWGSRFTPDNTSKNNGSQFKAKQR